MRRHAWLTGCSGTIGLLAMLAIPQIAGAQTIGTSGDKFTVSGVERFLFFVSYFDGLDATATHQSSDFEQLRLWGVDGIRVFPNWWEGDPYTYALDTVIRPDGTIRESAFSRLQSLLQRARASGLLVDVSFSAETVADSCGGEPCPGPPAPGYKTYASLTYEEAKAGIIEVARRLSGSEYRHVIFDIQNESNDVGPLWSTLSATQVAEIVQGIRGVDPLRIVTASVANSMSGADAGTRAEDSNQDVVAFHEPRVASWWTQTQNHVLGIRSTSPSKPIYLQEPPKVEGPPAGITAVSFRSAIQAAKDAGVAAWCFHTEAGFDMNQDSFVSRLNAVERGFLEDNPTIEDYWPYGTPSYQETFGVGSIDVPIPADYDGDGQADLAVYRKASSTFFIHSSADGTTWSVVFGNPNDRPVVADYDGDGRADIAVYRPSTATFWIYGQARFWINGNPAQSVTFGSVGDLPVVADYGGDGRADIAVYRPSTATFWVNPSEAGSPIRGVTFGNIGDTPVVADYGGDGKADVAVYRPSTAYFWVTPSDGTAVWGVLFGSIGDTPHVADYSGDGRADIAVFHVSNSAFYVRPSEGTPAWGLVWGHPGDVPVPADYAGDGTADPAVWRKSTGVWYVR